VALESAPIQFDPRMATDQASSRVFELAMNGLVTKDETGRFVPDLAERWELLDDGGAGASTCGATCVSTTARSSPPPTWCGPTAA
jgi:ABC-type transport system substrate-binding protein